MDNFTSQELQLISSAEKNLKKLNNGSCEHTIKRITINNVPCLLIIKISSIINGYNTQQQL